MYIEISHAVVRTATLVIRFMVLMALMEGALIGASTPLALGATTHR